MRISKKKDIFVYICLNINMADYEIEVKVLDHHTDMLVWYR